MHSGSLPRDQLCRTISIVSRLLFFDHILLGVSYVKHKTLIINTFSTSTLRFDGNVINLYNQSLVQQQCYRVTMLKWDQGINYLVTCMPGQRYYICIRE